MQLHPEFGTNPTIPVCFWCERPKDQIVVMGAAYDGQAPSMMVVNYVPCAQCAGRMRQGVALIEYVYTPVAKNQPHLTGHKFLYPTGRWAVITDEAAKEFWKSGKLLDKILDHGIAYLSVQVFKLFL